MNQAVQTLPFCTLVFSSDFVLADTVVVTAVLPALSAGILTTLVHTGVCRHRCVISYPATGETTQF